MSYASYISGFLRRNGLGVELFRKTLVVKQDPSKPSTGAIVHAKADEREGCKKALREVNKTLTDAGFTTISLSDTALKVSGKPRKITIPIKPIPEFGIWLKKFAKRNGLDLNHRFDMDIPPYGKVSVSLADVIRTCDRKSPPQAQATIKETLMRIESKNGNTMPFFARLADDMVYGPVGPIPPSGA